MYITSTMTSPGTKTAKTSKWLSLQLGFIMMFDFGMVQSKYKVAMGLSPALL